MPTPNQPTTPVVTPKEPSSPWPQQPSRPPFGPPVVPAPGKPGSRRGDEGPRWSWKPSRVSFSLSGHLICDQVVLRAL